MAEIHTHECDECHTQKKETNHWWVVYRHQPGAPNPNAVTVETFNPAIDRKSVIAKMYDACGIECALKLVQRRLQEVLAS